MAIFDIKQKNSYEIEITDNLNLNPKIIKFRGINEVDYALFLTTNPNVNNKFTMIFKNEDNIYVIEITDSVTNIKYYLSVILYDSIQKYIINEANIIFENPDKYSEKSNFVLNMSLEDNKMYKLNMIIYCIWYIMMYMTYEKVNYMNIYSFPQDREELLLKIYDKIVKIKYILKLK